MATTIDEYGNVVDDGSGSSYTGAGDPYENQDQGSTSTPNDLSSGALSQGLEVGLAGLGNAASPSTIQSASSSNNAANTQTLQNQPAPQEQGVFSKLMQGLGLKKSGSNEIDYSNPETLNKLLKLGGSAISIIGALTNKPQGQKSIADVRAELASPFNNWNPQQAAAADAYFNKHTPKAARDQLAAINMPSPIVAGRRYAGGGEVEPGQAQQGDMFYGPGALSMLVRGAGGGQDDLVSAALSPGEFVWDADTVSSIGDGDNARGAQILNEWREALRKHKRSAPSNQIPPKTKSVSAYFPKGAKHG